MTSFIKNPLTLWQLKTLCLWELSVAVDTRVSTRSDPKPYTTFPHPNDATHKIWSRLANSSQCLSMNRNIIKYWWIQWLLVVCRTDRNETKFTQIYEIQRIIITWAATWQNQQNGCAPSEDSDQPGHPPSLIRVFAVRMKKLCVLSYPLSAQQRLWSDSADAQDDDLSLR